MITIDVLDIVYCTVFAFTDVFLVGYCLNLILYDKVNKGENKIVGINIRKFYFIGFIFSVLCLIARYRLYFYPFFTVIELILVFKQFDLINRKARTVFKVTCLKVIIELFCILLMEMLFERPVLFNEFDTFNMLKFFWLFVSKYIECLIFLVIYRKKYRLGQSDLRYFKNIGMIISIMYGMCIVTYIESLFHITNIGKIVVFTLFIYNVTLIIFDRYQVKHDKIEREYNEKKRKFEIIDLKNKLQQKYNKKIQQEQNHTRNIKHNINNQLCSIHAYIENGRNEEAMEYIEKIIGTLKVGKSANHTGHIGADAILDEKLETARLLGIDVEENYGIIDFGDLTPMEITILLGCALDNAIEAIQKINDEDIEKKLTIHIFNNGPYLAICIGNSVVDGHNICFHKTSKKEDSMNHGFGVKDIQKVVSQHEGSVCYEVDDKFVLFNAILYVFHEK